MNSMNPKDYLPAAGLAREKHISRQRLSQLANEGKIKVVRIGRALLIERKSLDRYLSQRRERK